MYGRFCLWIRLEGRSVIVWPLDGVRIFHSRRRQTFYHTQSMDMPAKLMSIDRLGLLPLVAHVGLGTH